MKTEIMVTELVSGKRQVFWVEKEDMTTARFSLPEDAERWMGSALYWANPHAPVFTIHLTGRHR